jgi:hypothetical protein
MPQTLHGAVKAANKISYGGDCRPVPLQKTEGAASKGAEKMKSRRK